jgi:ribosomal protein L32
MFTWKRITALAIVVAGAVGAFAVYTFGWRDAGGNQQARTVYVTTETGRHRLYTIREGDVIRDPVTLTQCETSGEAGIPNLFCTHTGNRSRYQVVFWSDAVDVYDLARHGEPMVPTFSVPAKLKHASG